MRTFLWETELIYKRLKEEVEATSDAFVLEKYYVQQTGWDKPVFLCQYRGVNFLFLPGNAWNTPELSSVLGNLKERDRFCLFCDFLIYLHREEPSLISPAITAYEKGEFPTFLKETAQGTGKEETSNVAREILDLWNTEKEITSNIFSEPTVDDLFKEACELLPEYKEKLKGFYDAIGVENPIFKPPKFVPLWKKTGEGQYTSTLKFKQGQTPSHPLRPKIIFFSEEETETKEKLLLFQLLVGIYLFQKRKLSEEEKNELFFIKQKLNIKIDNLKFVETLWNFRGTASPEGLQICLRTGGKTAMSFGSPTEGSGEPRWVSLESLIGKVKEEPGIEEAEEVEEEPDAETEASLVIWEEPDIEEKPDVEEEEFSREPETLDAIIKLFCQDVEEKGGARAEMLLTMFKERWKTLLEKTEVFLQEVEVFNRRKHFKKINIRGEEEWWSIEEDNREKKKSLYRKSVTPFPPHYENSMSIGLVAELLDLEFSYLQETLAHWRDWVYDVIKRGKVKAFRWRKGAELPDDAKVIKLEKEFLVPNNIKYLTGSYLVTPKGLEELKRLAKEQREQSQKGEARAYFVKYIAEKKGITLRQAQKIIKGKTDEELRKFMKGFYIIYSVINTLDLDTGWLEKLIKGKANEKLTEYAKRLYIIRCITKNKSISIKQAQKIMKSKTDRELIKCVEALRGGRNESA